MCSSDLMFVEIQKGGAYVSDECFKMATTDAISVACKQLGIGADVYWDKDKTKYGSTENQEQKKPQDDEERRLLIKELAGELARTGFGWGAVEKKYGPIEGMTKLQIKDCISKMKKVEDRKAS